MLLQWIYQICDFESKNSDNERVVETPQLPPQIVIPNNPNNPNNINNPDPNNSNNTNNPESNNTNNPNNPNNLNPNSDPHWGHCCSRTHRALQKSTVSPVAQ